MAEENKIFRDKSLERVSSPEQLNQYIKTTTPSLWILLAAIIIFLGGIIFWATTGKIESNHKVGCEVSNGIMTCLIPESDYSKVKNDSYILLDGEKYVIDLINEEPEEATLFTNNYLLHSSDINVGDWYHTVIAHSNLQDGLYSGKIVYETINPITFVIN